MQYQQEWEESSSAVHVLNKVYLATNMNGYQPLHHSNRQGHIMRLNVPRHLLHML